MPKKKIVFRADGSKSAGFGHLARSAVLADAFRAGGFEILFSTASPDENVATFFGSRGFAFVPAAPAAGEGGGAALAETVRGFGASAAVLDSYTLDDAFRARLKREGVFVAAIDDVYSHFTNADAVINPNPSADTGRYAGFSGKLLAGPRYALLDPRFAVEAERVAGPSLRESPPAILVALGGTDNLNQLGRVLKLLDGVNGEFTIKALAGKYPAKNAGDLPLMHPREVIPFTEDMPRLIASCGAAITAGGATCMELACLGKPFLILLTDKYQLANAHTYQSRGCAKYAGALWETPDAVLAAAFDAFIRRRGDWPSMSVAGGNMVDGHGASRVFGELAPLLK